MLTTIQSKRALKIVRYKENIMLKKRFLFFLKFIKIVNTFPVFQAVADTLSDVPVDEGALGVHEVEFGDEAL